MDFDFEKLTVYRKALDFTDLIFAICENLPTNIQYSVGDQSLKQGPDFTLL
jgi:hypothetical protein